MKITRTREQLRSLTRVAIRSSLKRIFLLKSDVSRSIDADTYNKLQGQMTFEGTLLENKEDHFQSMVSCTVKGLAEEDDTVVEINSQFLLTYSVEPESDLAKEDISNFCETNALYNAWPFIREFVHSTCNRMEIPPLTLPLLKIVPPKRKKEKPEEDQSNSDKS